MLLILENDWTFPEASTCPDLYNSINHCDSHLLPLDVQTEQGDKTADLQQEINKDSQACKQRERPHGRHVGQSSCRERDDAKEMTDLLERIFCTFLYRRTN